MSNTPMPRGVMVPSGDAYNVDWIVASASNVYVVNHRDWFASYTPFETYVGSLYHSSQEKVLGIGTVHLNVRLYKHKRSGKPNSRVITLHNVLYVPGYICNVFGFPPPHDYTLESGGEQSGYSLKDKDDKRAGLVDFGKLLRVRLHGQSGQPSLDHSNTAYVINAQWPGTERVRWIMHLAEQLGIPLSISSNENPYPPTPKDVPDSKTTDVPDSKTTNAPELKTKDVPDATTEDAPYSAVEKAWLKVNFDGEYKFLRQHGLSIYKDEHRAEGRSIVRTMMKIEDVDEDEDELNDEDVLEDEDDSDDYDSDDEENSFLRELEEDPISHLADYVFSEAELDWIKKRYQYSSKFMMCFGLKPFEDEDCDEAKSIIKVMMESD